VLPSWLACPTKAIAMTALDKLRRYRVDRPLASAMVPMRPVCRLKCSVVNAVTSLAWGSG
jgi:hypothetical protein